MTIRELKKYLEYAEPDLDVVVLDRKTYDKLMSKVRVANVITDKLKIFLKERNF